MISLNKRGGTAVHRVLLMPEFLDMVFGYLDNNSNLSNILVCKQWSEHSLDKLWKEVRDLYRLFTILTPMRETSNGGYEFIRLPESADWKRFERYSCRVRKLIFHESEQQHVLKQSVFDDIARTRTHHKILPSMRSLDWSASLPLCIMFMHINVTQFTISLPMSESPRPFFQDIIYRMPNITHLDIRSSFPMNAIEKDVIQLFEGLKKLEKVVMPRYYFTTRIAETLSYLESLGVVEFQYKKEQGCGDSSDTAVFAPAFTEGAFPSLWDLSLTVRFVDAARFISGSFAPINLTILFVDSILIESPDDVHAALSAISENCYLLSTLALISGRDLAIDNDNFPSSDKCIDMETLEPLLHFPCLTSLELMHQYPFDLRQADIEALAASWPSLEMLILNNEPVVSSQSTLTLDSLLPFARHCPRLRHLGLFINASPSNLIVPEPPSIRYPVFAALETLSMGVSIIEEASPVALFLSQICPLSCTIESGVTWDNLNSTLMLPEITNAITERCHIWEEVMGLLPVLIKLRLEEKNRMKSLQSEVEDLRMRTGVLMDRTKVHMGSDACIAV